MVWRGDESESESEREGWTYGEGGSEVVGIVCPVGWYYWVEGELEGEAVWECLEGG